MSLTLCQLFTASGGNEVERVTELLDEGAFVNGQYKVSTCREIICLGLLDVFMDLIFC